MGPNESIKCNVANTNYIVINDTLPQINIYMYRRLFIWV